MEVEEEWSSLASPYRAAAERLGFQVLERHIRAGIPPSPQTTFLCVEFLFDGKTTFLDIGGVIARGPHHRGLLIGLNGIQLYTFVQTPSLTFVLTNGATPNEVKKLARMRWNPLYRFAEKLIPEDHRSVPMRGPEDLRIVVERHGGRVRKGGGEPVEVTGPPLEFRWRMMDECEKEGE